MTKRLSAQPRETVKANPDSDRLLGDGDGLFLGVSPHGTKTWLIEYEFQGERIKCTIGGYSRQAAPGDSIPEWPRHGQQSLTQARSIAGAWNAALEARAERIESLANGTNVIHLTRVE